MVSHLIKWIAITYWIFKSLQQFQMPIQKKSGNLSYAPRILKHVCTNLFYALYQGHNISVILINCTELYDFELLIIFLCKSLNSFIWLIDGTLTGITRLQVRVDLGVIVMKG